MEKKINHFFIQLSGITLGKPFTYESGRYVKSNGFLYKSESEKNDIGLIKEKISGLAGQNIHALVYIHGYLAENPWFASLSGYNLQKNIFENTGHDVSLVLSLQWDSGFQYNENRKLAYQKGKMFADYIRILNDIITQNNSKVRFSFLLHSMGNIVFQGLFSEKKILSGILPFHQVFLCAADLSSHIFEQDFSDLHKYCREIHIFYHEKDKTLRIANAFTAFHRLGIYGNEGKFNSQNIKNINVTNIADDDTAIGSRFSHHRYFYGSKKVRDYINSQLGKY
jgi:esterase/lipase superfamily enzyme